MSGGVAEVRTALWRSRGMQALIGVTVLGFASFCLTLASLPVYAVGGGAAASTAGLVTAVFLVVTVAFQATIPALTTRFGVGPVLVAGLLAMGLPSPFYVVDDGLAWICALSAVRGAGFAVLTVLGATLAARVAPPERRGESVGLYGLAIAIPNLVAVPAGVALVLDGHVGWLSWLAASPVLGAFLVPRLVRSVGPQPGPGPAGSGRAAVRAALLPSAVLFLVTMAGGGLVTFLPIERPDGVLATVALLVFGVTGAVTRWRSGTLSDRLGTGLLLPLALVVAAVGMVVTAVGLDAGAGWVLAGAAVFGAGYGAAQNLTLVAAFARAGEGGTTTASAMWNASFDAGTAIGALALGFLAAGIGLDWTYVVVAALLAGAVPLASAAARVAIRS
ncbi:MFS transporter [Blastococcus haudaquaticus]|uniref:Predicted arabinose efflux permease, MFS family n=1 Tax=Blastococcus haudaquaticus TaxID=1938745 RepID=A0A286H3X8_9ACTN|nr:MFS transporter [Blastococcus haudaquaticus]SOE02500.1 Predicted arabinose efflux permease, MFS family [Blastococcus haudaquaticus]